MNILITNDDGIGSEGILALEKVLRKKHHVYLIAPLKEKSATSQALSIFDRIRVEKHSENRVIVDGYPCDCVNIGLHGNVFPKIDAVVSGINRGVNMGHDVHYSGTVGAARHASIHGILSFSVSSGRFGKDVSYQREAEAFFEIFENLHSVFQPGCVYNINFPPNFDSVEKSLRAVSLGKRIYHDTYEVTEFVDGIYEFYLGGSELGNDLTPETDFEAYSKGCVTLTPIELNTTDFDRLEKLKESLNNH
ncbi:MAG TPA: 5'/3'-nucleotidase SurE [Leptospiraceae bacterium]|nr:5'/3'-nucleotidase SurE [Leptospiraceae bacterium]HNF16388.1 5'/3'-nucleotidase SurE [Leptospiraceae bacterium]HNF27056.1 5'/3'-nucleotidase SurE [Leptospiraceae bacterium]HNI98071.1 5'/3'-nucleotidase SurE [Leptospiraceae bacterium]HNM04613.1 5'/3'-nucleotidase SurE [Leptospiraceae bacterium]